MGIKAELMATRDCDSHTSDSDECDEAEYLRSVAEKGFGEMFDEFSLSLV